MKHVINTGDHPPVRHVQLVHLTPFMLRNKVDETVQEMLTQGVIHGQPSQSPWASPIVLVKKKDGGILTIYHQLNCKLEVFPFLV